MAVSFHLLITRGSKSVYRFLALVDTQRKCIVGSVCWSNGTLLCHFFAMIYPWNLAENPQQVCPPAHSSPTSGRLESQVHILKISEFEDDGRDQGKILHIGTGQREVSNKADGPTPPKQPQPCEPHEPYAQVNVCRKWEHCDSCDDCKWHGSKGEDHDVRSDNGNIGKFEEYLGPSMQPNDEQLKNKIELSEELVICEHGNTWTSVFWHGDQWSTHKEWTWVKYVIPMSPWDDLTSTRNPLRSSWDWKVNHVWAMNRPRLMVFHSSLGP